MKSNADPYESKEAANAYQLAFKDPEFLGRPETRGIRFQLELLKPELDLAQAGIENTIVVFGSARFDETNTYYEAARSFARLVAKGCESDHLHRRWAWHYGSRQPRRHGGWCTFGGIEYFIAA
jgi:hypothetical protein